LNNSRRQAAAMRSLPSACHHCQRPKYETRPSRSKGINRNPPSKLCGQRSLFSRSPGRSGSVRSCRVFSRFPALSSVISSKARIHAPRIRPPFRSPSTLQDVSTQPFPQPRTVFWACDQPKAGPHLSLIMFPRCDADPCSTHGSEWPMRKPLCCYSRCSPRPLGETGSNCPCWFGENHSKPTEAPFSL